MANAQEIKDQINIVDVIGEYLELEKRGKNYFALCPFHEEDTPSFSVTPEYGIYKCFGCGANGDVFDFIQEMHGCNFNEAGQILADKYDVNWSNKQSTKQNKKRDLVFKLHKSATQKYVEWFWGKQGEKARQYMLNRGFTKETLKKFNVGYAPDDWQNITDLIDDEVYMKAGIAGDLIRESNGRYYDRYRGRIMFPIHDTTGRTVGFGGRIIGKSDDDEPKYLNTSDTPIFDKSSTLYALNWAREHIRKTDKILLMEGYTDVMACHQAGYNNAIASLGTSLTNDHANRINGYGAEVIMLYDGDDPGIQAMERAGAMCMNKGIETKAATVPEDSDPGDLALQNPDRLANLINNADNFFEAQLNWAIDRYGINESQSKKKVLDDVTDVIKLMPTMMEREEAAKRCAAKLSISSDAVMEMVEEKRSNKNRGNKNKTDSVFETEYVIEELLFQSIAQNPGQGKQVVEELEADYFADNINKKVFNIIKDSASNDKVEPKKWIQKTEDEIIKNRIITILSQSDDIAFVKEADPFDIAAQLKSVDSSRERQKLINELMEYERDGDNGVTDFKKKILRRITELKKNSLDQTE